MIQIIMFQLKEKLQFTDDIKSIELYTSIVPSNTIGIISGWGKTFLSGSRVSMTNQISYGNLYFLNTHDFSSHTNNFH